MEKDRRRQMGIKSTIPIQGIGEFSVSATKKVEFAPGNLQAVIGSYTAPIATASSWKFAKHQWDYIGSSAGNITFSVGLTVDLFGWVGASTSYDSYGLCTNSASNSASYYGTSASDALKTDWGSIPDVISDCGAGWYTLSSAEWNYVISDRTSGATVNGTPNARYTEAIINTEDLGRSGVILFPDGVTIASSEATTWGAINNTSSYGTRCTTTQWIDLESKGCVFLPAAGYRQSSSVKNSGTYGYYWSSTPYSIDVNYAQSLRFYSVHMYPQDSNRRYYGFAVRLAREI